jgi:subtilisin family serine protease
MEQFPHLNFTQKVSGKPRLFGGGGKNDTSETNKANRGRHGNILINKTGQIKANWGEIFHDREKQGLAKLDSEIVPIFIQINPELLNNPEFDLHAFGIEIISEENDGFILGASFDSLRALEEKINGFVQNTHGTGKIADFWNIIEGDRSTWKPQHILSEELYAKWQTLSDEENYNVEIGVAFDMPVKQAPDPSKQGGAKRLNDYNAYLVERDNKLLERQDHFEEFIKTYGTLKTGFVDLDDSFSCEAIISGKGLKDLVVNYQYVFEVNEVEVISGIKGDDFEADDFQVDIIAPDDNSPVIGVIDSGIMENHKYIESAIDIANSKSYIYGDNSCSDLVQGGGHGTKVAGAILYPKGITGITLPYQLPCFIRNLRVLDHTNHLRHKYPAELMQEIIQDNSDCTIFNLSVNSNAPFRKKHMSTWAAIIDTLMHEHDILFIVSAGNITSTIVKDYIVAGQIYPDYLHNANCKTANPGQSAFSITVGSINHCDFEDDFWKSLGGENNISAFSRIGTGIWNSIKPDVVEYGGGLALSKNGLYQVNGHSETFPELIRSTLYGGSAFGKDVVGTSFAAPKVTFIAAQLKKLYPEENSNLLRAFIVQGARLPNDHFLNPNTQSIKYFGYGIPSLERVTTNTEHRITFYNTGSLSVEEGHIYSLQLPAELNDPANDFDVLIEVTLAYTAKVRRTRQRMKSYLSSWLDWTVSRLDESHDEFVKRSLLDEEALLESEENEHGVIQWKIRERSNWGAVKEINRNNNTVQKDWAVLKAYELPREISFAIRGHKGWDRTGMELPYAFTVSIEVLGNDIPIYESIRIVNQIEIET